jgi:plastocyanin
MINIMRSVCVVAVLATGCGGGAKKPTTTASGGEAASTAEAVNGCTTYKDMTETGATIPWDESIASSDMRCIKIKVDQTVGYTGNLTTHPMKGSGGASPNPFDQAVANVSNPGAADEQTNVAFSAPGTFGFVCGVHPSMTGAVLVVP